MRSAFGTAISTAEVVIPCLHEPRMIFFNHFLNAADFNPAEAAAAVKHYRFKPEFRYFVVPFNVNMPRFVFITGIKEKTVRSNPQNGRQV
jgi:hypothetical protein